MLILVYPTSEVDNIDNKKKIETVYLFQRNKKLSRGSK